MCGIAGFVRFDGRPVARQDLERMVRAIAHRGPDGEGSLTRDPVALGHRRLAIVDLDTGQQPMCNEDRSVAVVCNGEIYNHLELRQLLEARGHRFRTRSDIEVLVHAWEEWGRRCVEKLRGMYAFVISDWRRRQVFLARDHFGIKPLYYRLDEDCLAFASELQALRALSATNDRPSLEALDLYLSLGYVPAPRSIYQGVKKLSPASRLLVPFDGSRTSPETYWRLEYQPVSGKSAAAWAEDLEATLRESVEAHLMSDVPFGAFLSGGLDSTAIVTYMTQVLETPVKTFSIGFEEDRFNELPHARKVARQLGTEHHEEIVRAEGLSILPKLVQHHGEPFGDSSAVPTYYVSRLARRHVAMVLSGDGGDEALGGYHKYLAWLRRIDPRLSRPWWKRWLRPLASRAMPGRFPPDPKSPRAEALLAVNQNVTAAWRRRLWRRDLHASLDFESNPFQPAFRESADWDPLFRAQHADYQTYLPNDILTKVDVASMMHGLEVRTPFVDVKVVERMATIPSQLHVGRDRQGAWQTKRLLKQLMRPHYPPDFVERRKMGFSIPISIWFDNDGSFQTELLDRIGGERTRIAEYFEPSAVRAMISDHGRERNYSQGLWYLLFLETWLEQRAAS